MAVRINEVDRKTDGSIIHVFEIAPKTRLRYIRVEATNGGVVPPWHKGAGGDSWILAEEILVEVEEQGNTIPLI